MGRNQGPCKGGAQAGRGPWGPRRKSFEPSEGRADGSATVKGRVPAAAPEGQTQKGSEAQNLEHEHVHLGEAPANTEKIRARRDATDARAPRDSFSGA